MKPRQEDLIAPGADIDDDDHVELRRLRSGSVVLVPRALRNLGGSDLQQAAFLQEEAATVQDSLARLTGRVVAARARGLSWNTIGWCVGLSADGARRRWQEASDGA